MTKTPSIEVLITIPIGASLIKILQEVSPRLRLIVNPAQKAVEIPNGLWKRCEVLYTGSLLPSPEAAPNLKWIQFHYAGIDHALDSPLLEKPDLLVTTLSGAAASQTAEHVLAMLLAFARKLPAHQSMQVKSEWPKERGQALYPRELRTSTVGIVGYGSVGRQVARLLREFGATVLATKQDAMHPADSGFSMENLGDPDGDLVHRLYPSQALKSMLKDCDFVVVAVPLTRGTRGLLNAETLAACKPTAYLVDVSRGGVVDHAALIKALSEHKLAGAALDVFPEEPLPSKSPLWKFPNVILTPHMAGLSTHYEERAMRLFAENLSRYVAELPLYNLLDPVRGY